MWAINVSILPEHSEISLKPTSHIFCEAKPYWYEIPDDVLPKYSQFIDSPTVTLRKVATPATASESSSNDQPASAAAAS